MARYTWTLYKFWLEDSKEKIVYWQLELKDKILRFKSFELMREFIKNLPDD